jgi:hypothetical protein
MGYCSSLKGEEAMKRTLRLVTSDENRVRIELEDWRSGIDGRHRHWVLGEEYWFCVETDEIAREAQGRRPSTSQIAPGCLFARWRSV